ncbi:hypothetical protein [Rubinisphaera sp. JC750]|uniref:hypothetical protein n=1 Tax=Rubinisphaera sp. JC750 TaxID=2898658 RepID=UPI001F19A2BE|nr:hypothetical protein [Rubinisphaera sp. JC750]
MDFAIQVSNPSSVGGIEDDESIGEALETIFSLNTESAFVIWNHLYVPLNYKCDVSLILEDVVFLVETVSASQNGNTTIHWPSSTFRARWEVSWKEDNVVVEARWESVIGDIESLLNQHPSISVPKSAFLSEWGELIKTCLNHLRIRNTSSSLDLTRLESVLSLVSERGTLYR